MIRQYQLGGPNIVPGVCCASVRVVVSAAYYGISCCTAVMEIGRAHV